MTKLSENSLLREAYAVNKDINDEATWSSSIKYILKELNLYSYWQNPPENNGVVHKARKILKQRYENNWLSNMHNDTRKKTDQRNKLRTYRQFKLNFEKETYLGMQNVELRQKISCFRSSCHKLHIETGRYPYKPPEQRTCKVCNEMDIEDEKHFLVTCKAHRNIRNIMYEKIREIFPDFQKLSDNDKFIWILSSRVREVQYALARFLEAGFASREKTLNPAST